MEVVGIFAVYPRTEFYRNTWSQLFISYINKLKAK